MFRMHSHVQNSPGLHNILPSFSQFSKTILKSWSFKSLRFTCYIQHSLSCCIRYAISRPQLGFVFGLIQHGRSCCIYRLHEIELLKSRKNIILTKSVYMASITSGEMTDCDWLRSTFSGHYSKTKWKFENYNLICY
jgi:hypothetical protein